MTNCPSIFFLAAEIGFHTGDFTFQSQKGLIRRRRYLQQDCFQVGYAIYL